MRLDGSWPLRWRLNGARYSSLVSHVRAREDEVGKVVPTGRNLKSIADGWSRYE